MTMLDWVWLLLMIGFCLWFIQLFLTRSQAKNGLSDEEVKALKVYYEAIYGVHLGEGRAMTASREPSTLELWVEKANKEFGLT